MKFKEVLMRAYDMGIGITIGGACCKNIKVVLIGQGVIAISVIIYHLFANKLDKQ